MTGSPEALWRPNPGPQTRFLACPFYEALFGGSAGGGKSDALLIDALGQAHLPRYRALIIRRSYPELTELIQRSREIYPVAFPGASYNRTDKAWSLPSGARIEFGYVGSDDDVYRYQGQAYSYVGWDELTHFSEWAYLYLMSRVRSTDPAIRCYIRATANPGGVGHHWVKARFIDAAPAMTPISDPLTGTQRVFIPSRLSDNPHLARTDYGNRLLALPDADRKALLDGDWNAYQGSVFDFHQGVHIWSWDDFKARTGHAHIPDEWTRFRTMDWGYAKPFSAHWFAVDFEGRAYVYREWYGCKTDDRGQVVPNTGLRLDPEGVAIRVSQLERNERILTGWTGPDLGHTGRGDHGEGKPIKEAFDKQGVYWEFWNASPGSRVAAKMALHERLKYETDEGGSVIEWPGLIFIGSECPHAIRTIPALEYDDHRVEDVDTTMEDHAYDSIKGFCLMRPWAPRAAVTKPKWMQTKGRSSGWI